MQLTHKQKSIISLIITNAVGLAIIIPVATYIGASRNSLFIAIGASTLSMIYQILIIVRQTR